MNFSIDKSLSTLNKISKIIKSSQSVSNLIFFKINFQMLLKNLFLNFICSSKMKFKFTFKNQTYCDDFLQKVK